MKTWPEHHTLTWIISAVKHLLATGIVKWAPDGPSLKIKRWNTGICFSHCGLNVCPMRYSLVIILLTHLTPAFATVKTDVRVQLNWNNKTWFICSHLHFWDTLRHKGHFFEPQKTACIPFIICCLFLILRWAVKFNSLALVNFVHSPPKITLTILHESWLNKMCMQIYSLDLKQRRKSCVIMN